MVSSNRACIYNVYVVPLYSFSLNMNVCLDETINVRVRLRFLLLGVGVCMDVAINAPSRDDSKECQGTIGKEAIFLQAARTLVGRLFT